METAAHQTQRVFPHARNPVPRGRPGQGEGSVLCCTHAGRPAVVPYVSAQVSFTSRTEVDAHTGSLSTPDSLFCFVLFCLVRVRLVWFNPSGPFRHLTAFCGLAQRARLGRSGTDALSRLKEVCGAGGVERGGRGGRRGCLGADALAGLKGVACAYAYECACCAFVQCVYILHGKSSLYMCVSVNVMWHVPTRQAHVTCLEYAVCV